MLQDKLTGMINHKGASTVDIAEKKPRMESQDTNLRPHKKRKIVDDDTGKKGIASCRHTHTSRTTTITSPNTPAYQDSPASPTRKQLPQIPPHPPRISAVVSSTHTTTNLFTLSSLIDSPRSRRTPLYDIQPPSGRVLSAPDLPSAFHPLHPTPLSHPTTQEPIKSLHHNNRTVKTKVTRNNNSPNNPEPNHRRLSRSNGNSPERRGILASPDASLSSSDPQVEWEVAQVINELSVERMVPPLQSKMSIAALLN